MKLYKINDPSFNSPNQQPNSHKTTKNTDNFAPQSLFTSRSNINYVALKPIQSLKHYISQYPGKKIDITKQIFWAILMID